MDRNDKANSPSSRRGVAFAFIFLFLTICAAPLAAGAVHRETQAVLAFCVFLGGLVFWLTKQDKKNWILPRAVFFLAVGLILINVVQIIPLPHEIIKVLSPETYEWYSYLLIGPNQATFEPLRWIPLSFAPVESRLSLGRILLYFCFFTLCFQVLIETEAREKVLFTVSILGALSFWIALIHTLLGSERILGIYELRDKSAFPFMSTFVNPNFQAGFYGMAGLVALGLSRSHRHEKVIRIAMIVAAVFSFSGVYLTLSRGGMVFLPVALLLFWFLSRRFTSSLKWTIPIVSSLWLVVALYLASTNIAKELLSVVPWGDNRDFSKLEIWPPMLRIARDFWQFGIGNGAFPSVFTHYHPELAASSTFEAGENELLQVLVDYGVPAGVLILSGCLWVLLGTLKSEKMTSKTAGVFSALFFLICHNLSDFNISSPGIMIPVLALIAYLWSRSPSKGNYKSHQWITLPRTIVVALLLSALLSSALLWGYRDTSLRTVGKNLKLLTLKANPDDPEFDEIFSKAQEQFPADYYIYTLKAYHLIRSQRKQSDSPPVLHYINRSLYLHPNHWFAHLLAAECLRTLGYSDQSFSEFRQAFLCAKGYNKLSYIVTRVYKNGVTPEATVKFSGDSQSIQIYLLRYLLNAGMPQVAFESMILMGFMINATASEAIAILVADILYKSGHNDELRLYIEQVKSFYLRSSWIYLSLANLETRTGNLDKALETLFAGKEIVSQEYRQAIIQQIASMLYQKGDISGITELIDADRDIKPILHNLYYTRGLLYALKGEINEAVTDFRASKLLQPSWINPYIQIARLWEKNKKWELAIMSYREVLLFSPSNVVALSGIAKAEEEMQKESLLKIMGDDRRPDLIR